VIGAPGRDLPRADLGLAGEARRVAGDDVMDIVTRTARTRERVFGMKIGSAPACSRTQRSAVAALVEAVRAK